MTTPNTERSITHPPSLLSDWGTTTTVAYHVWADLTRFTLKNHIDARYRYRRTSQLKLCGVS